MRPSFWKYIFLFFGGQLVGMAAALMFGVLETMINRGGSSTVSGDFSDITFCIPLLTANIFIIALFLLFWPSDVSWETLTSGWQKSRRNVTLRYVMAGLGMIPFVNIMQELLLSGLPDFVGEQRLDLILSHPLGIIAVCLLGPVAEELCFRAGMIRLPEGDAPLSPIRPIIISSVIFALIHLNPAQMPAAFIIGLLLGAAYFYTGSIVAPLLIHIINNTIAAVLSAVVPVGESGEAVTLTEVLGGTVPSIFVAIAGLFLAFFCLKRNFSMYNKV